MNMLARLLIIAVASGLLQVGTAAAQKPGQKQLQKPLPKQAESRKDGDKARPMAITPEREALVTSFAERNHPELAGLLTHLKTNQPKEYERAVRDLFRVTEKLAMVHERDSRQYDAELRAWKAQSRAQLLVARLKMTDPESADSEELKDQLREILSEQIQARLEVLKLERERVTGRLERLNEDIARMERDRESAVEGHLKMLTSQVDANRPKAKSPEKKSLNNK